MMEKCFAIMGHEEPLEFAGGPTSTSSCIFLCLLQEPRNILPPPAAKIVDCPKGHYVL